MKKTILAIGIIFTVIIFATTSCDPKPSITAVSFENTDSLIVNFNPTSTFAFFNFKNNTVVANTDSASLKWDFGLRLTTFILNSHTYGTGNAGAILQNSIYANVTTAPTTGYAYDTTASQLAIKDGSWYDYDLTTHAFSPKAGQTFIFTTADNHFVKMELLSVGYEAFTGTTPVHLIYRFRYTYQTNGSPIF